MLVHGRSAFQHERPFAQRSRSHSWATFCPPKPCENIPVGLGSTGDPHFQSSNSKHSGGPARWLVTFRVLVSSAKESSENEVLSSTPRFRFRRQLEPIGERASGDPARHRGGQGARVQCCDGH